ncbi:MAG: site-specific integrase [Planctomycetaceae bacterium]|nr:site-specific integrase [Planctomycetaceae bacterium]
MTGDIHVHVVDRGRRCLYLRFVDPVDGKVTERSSGVSRRREAERLAERWAAELKEGRARPATRIAWSEFRQQYEEEHLSSLSSMTDAAVSGTFNVAEQHLPILKGGKLSTLDESRISKLQNSLRRAGVAESTIAKHMRHLKAALNWAKRMRLIERVPNIEMPKRARRSSKQTPMKGRPLYTEEFERMLAAAPKVIGELAAPSWRFLLEGLWWSGLRLGEALDLWWDRDDRLRLDFSIDPRFPMLQIPSELEKGNKDRLTPVAPEFARFLESVSLDQRRGRVFRLKTQRGADRQLSLPYVSKRITDLGRAANVRVSERGKVKYASAHDLRRSFGDRWAARVMPPALQQLMRHDSIETTLRYYVGKDAVRTSALLWQALHTKSDSLGDTLAFSTSLADNENAGSSNLIEASGKGAARIRTGE